MAYDFLRLVKDYGIDFIQDVPGWINIHCPICHHEGTRGYKGGLAVNIGIYHCWACGWHPLDKVISELLNVSIYSVEDILKNYEDSYSVRQKINKKQTKPISKIELPIDYLTKKGKEYIESRNFDSSFIYKKYKASGILFSGEWSYRIIIPIFLDGKIISFQARSIFNKKKCKDMGILRYKNLSIMKSIIDPKNTLYNIDNCKGTKLILVEGVFDCWRFGDNCAATFGTSFTESQITKVILNKNINEVFLIYDPEFLASRKAIQFSKRLSAQGLKVKFIDTELDHDPGDMNEKEVKEIKTFIGVK